MGQEKPPMCARKASIVEARKNHRYSSGFSKELIRHRDEIDE